MANDNEDVAQSRDATWSAGGVPPGGGFALASGRAMAPVSAAALKRARAVMEASLEQMPNDDDGNMLFTNSTFISTNTTIAPNVSDTTDTDHHSRRSSSSVESVHQLDDARPQAPPPRLAGFGTASGKALPAPKQEALERARLLLKESDEENKQPTPSIPASNTDTPKLISPALRPASLLVSRTNTSFQPLAQRNQQQQQTSSSAPSQQLKPIQNATALLTRRPELKPFGRKFRTPFKSPMRLMTNNTSTGGDISIKSPPSKAPVESVNGKMVDNLRYQLGKQVLTDVTTNITVVKRNTARIGTPDDETNIKNVASVNKVDPIKSETNDLASMHKDDAFCTSSTVSEHNDCISDLTALKGRRALKDLGLPFNGTRAHIEDLLAGRTPPRRYRRNETFPELSLLKANAEDKQIIRDCLDITSTNSEQYRFNVHTPYSYDYIEHVYNTFKAKYSKINPTLISKEWIANHYGLIVWKLAVLVRKYPGRLSPSETFSLDAVLSELAYRYEVEINRAKRPCLKLIYEFDDTPAKPMVLCVYAINKGEQESTELVLTDGWYKIRAVIDLHLQSLVRLNKIEVGTKLYIIGAVLDGLNEPISPLDSHSTNAYLNIHVNSVRRATWDKRLGFHIIQPTLGKSDESSLVFVPVGLHQIVQGGGTIPALKLIVQRRYEPFTLETKDDGEVIRLSKAQDASLQRDWETEHEHQYSRILRDYPLDPDDFPNKSPTEVDVIKHHEFLLSMLEDSHKQRNISSILPVLVVDFPVVSERPDLVRQAIILVKLPSNVSDTENDLLSLFWEGNCVVLTKMKVAYIHTEFGSLDPFRGVDSLMQLIPTKDTSYFAQKLESSQEESVREFMKKNNYFERLSLQPNESYLANIDSFVDKMMHNKCNEFDLAFAVVTVLDETGAEYVPETPDSSHHSSKPTVESIVKLVGADWSQQMIVVEIKHSTWEQICMTYKPEIDRKQMIIVNNGISRKKTLGTRASTNLISGVEKNDGLESHTKLNNKPHSALQQTLSESITDTVGTSCPTRLSLMKEHFVLSFKNLEYNRMDSELGLRTFVETRLTTWNFGHKVNSRNNSSGLLAPVPQLRDPKPTASGISELNLESWTEDNLQLLHELKYGFRLRDCFSGESVSSM